MPCPHGGVEERHAGHQSNKRIGCEAAVGQTGKGFFSVPPFENFGHFLPCIQTRSMTCKMSSKVVLVTLSILVLVSSFSSVFMKFPAVDVKLKMEQWTEQAALASVNCLARFTFPVRHQLYPHCALSRLIQRPPLS